MFRAIESLFEYLHPEIERVAYEIGDEDDAVIRIRSRVDPRSPAPIQDDAGDDVSNKENISL